MNSDSTHGVMEIMRRKVNKQIIIIIIITAWALVIATYYN